MDRWTKIRFGFSAAYFLLTGLILSLYSYNSYFCSSERTGRSHVLTIVRLAAACTLWDLFISVAIAKLARIHAHQSRQAGAILLTTIVTGIGFASMPFWIYRGYGVFLFENTWADVSCFFTEDYGMLFPIFIAPLLAAMTGTREYLHLKISKGRLN